MHECPYCVDGERFRIEMEPVEVDDRTGSKRYMCPECGYEMWDGNKQTTKGLGLPKL